MKSTIGLRWALDGLAVATLALVVFGLRNSSLPQETGAAPREVKRPAEIAADLQRQCAEVSLALRAKLGEQCHAIVRAPFVIAGDLPEADLAAWHRRTISPAARAIAKSYTSKAPHEPITILLFASEKSYRGYAERLYRDRDVSVYGYYKPSLRTMLMNISTGGGTLVHELTHALVDFDFADIPDWFNEGLASLHEQCHIREDESGIEGLVNWRLPALQKALAEGRLRPLEELIGSDDFRGRSEALNYAHARYFCMYLQRQGVLAKFYRTFREQRKADPLGLKSVRAVFPGSTWDELNASFRRWAAELRQ